MSRLSVQRIEPLKLVGTDALAGLALMSPYVWRMAEDKLGMLVRAIADTDDQDLCMGNPWYGDSSDGLLFTMSGMPVLVPEAGTLDANGCEDPTVVLYDGEVIVFYTGVDADGEYLLWASGPDIHSLTKHGVTLGAFNGEQDVREAEITVRDGRWTMGYEYVRSEASLIGYAEGDGPAGPWRKTEHGFGPREDRFDCWHLSPGPMLLDDPDHPIMFYNGATRDAGWAIGSVVFDHANNSVLDRCEEPLVASPAEQDGHSIAFAASLIDRGTRVDLYLSYNDRSLHRAMLTRRDKQTLAEQR